MAVRPRANSLLRRFSFLIAFVAYFPEADVWPAWPDVAQVRVCPSSGSNPDRALL